MTYTVRKHWYVLFNLYFAAFVIALVPLAAFLALRSYFPVVPTQIPVFVYLAILLIDLGGVWYQHYVWENTTWTLTDSDIIERRQTGLFAFETIEAVIAEIEDIRVKIPGFLASTFDYGTIELTVSGDTPDMSMTEAYHPNEVRALIISLREARRSTGRKQAA